MKLIAQSLNLFEGQAGVAEHADLLGDVAPVLRVLQFPFLFHWHDMSVID